MLGRDALPGGLAPRPDRSRVMLGAVVAAVRMIDHGRAPAKAMMAQPAPAPAPTNSRSLVLRANAGGHFAVDARVDGRRLGFMVDTGASQITIRASDAARLGLHPRERDYTVKISTANGEGRAAVVELRAVKVGDITCATCARSSFPT